MTKLTLLKIVNPLLLVSVALQAITGLIFFFEVRLPRLSTLLEIHEYNGLAMLALAAAHITLNFGWIKANLLKR